MIPYTEDEIQIIIEQHFTEKKIKLDVNPIDPDDYCLSSHSYDTNNSIDDVIDDHEAVIKEIVAEIQKIDPKLLIRVFELGYQMGNRNR